MSGRKKRGYDPYAALAKVAKKAERLDASKVLKLRHRYTKHLTAPLLGWLLRSTEKRAWNAAHKTGRSAAAAHVLRGLAGKSNAARNAGLAVLMRDQISRGQFRRLTAVWRYTWLTLPAGPRRETKEGNSP